MPEAHDDPLAVLASFGLTGYQARAYLALLELGPSQAREVSERSGVPQGRVYDILEKLHQRGLAEVLPETPRRYRAVPFEVFLERELRGHRDWIDKLEHDRESLVSAMAPAQEAAPPERGEYVVARGRKQVLQRVTALLASAQRDALLLSTERGPERVQAAGDAAGDAVARGVRLRLLAPITPENADAVRGCLALGAEVRHQGRLREAWPAGLNVLIADGQRALLFQHLPDDAHSGRGDDVGLAMEHPQMVQGLGALAETIWALAAPATTTLDDLARGLAPAPQGHTVLLVDDEPDVLDSLRELLEGSLQGVRVLCAASADEGLAMLGQQPVDLVVTDYKLPGMNGLDLLEEARKRAPEAQRILITAFPDIKVAVRAINEARVEHFLTKPFQAHQLVDAVRAALAARGERRLRDRALERALDSQRFPPAA